MLHVQLRVEAKQIQSTVEIKLFYCFFPSEEANDLIFLSSITLEDQPKKERMYLDTLHNQVMSSNIVENPKSRIRKKVKSKIPVKAKSIDNSTTLENPSKSERYCKSCGVNGVLHRNNDVLLPYICPLFHKSVDPFHADATYSPPNYWHDETPLNWHISTNILHWTRFCVQPNSYLRTIIILSVLSFGFDVYQINLLCFICKYLQIDFVYFWQLDIKEVTSQPKIMMIQFIKQVKKETIEEGTNLCPLTCIHSLLISEHDKQFQEHQNLIRCGEHTLTYIHNHVNGVSKLTWIQAILTNSPASHHSFRDSRTTLYQGLCVVFGLPEDAKLMEFPCLPIAELNKQKAWLIIGNNQTRLFYMFTVQHNWQTISMEKHVLLPSKIAMNILWIPVLDITLVSSVGLPFG